MPFHLSIGIIVGNRDSHTYLLGVLWNIERRVGLLLLLLLLLLFGGFFGFFFEKFLEFSHFFWVAALVEVLEGRVLGFDIF